MNRPYAILLLILLVFASGFCKITLFLKVYANEPTSIFSPDSRSYLDTARAFVSTGRFAVSPEKPDAPQIMRTPGYPLFLAPFFFLFGENYSPIILAQIMLSIGTIFVIYLLAAMFWTHYVGLLAALFLSLDLSSFLSTQKILTETLFTFFLSIAMFCSVQALRRTHTAKTWFFFHAMLLAAATLVRPITYYAIIPLTAAFIMIWRQYNRSSWKSIVNMTTLLLLPWILLIGGWQVRNYRVAGTTDVSGIVAQNLLFYRGADILAQRERISFVEAQARLGYHQYAQRHPETADWSPAQLQQHWKREGLRLIVQHPWLFIKSQFWGLIKILLGTGEKSFLTYIGLTERSGPLSVLFQLPFAVYWQRWVEPHPWLVLLFFLTGIYLILLYTSMSFSLWRLIRTRSRQFWPVHLVLWGLMFYLLLVSAGPEAYSRFRVALMPFFSVYAGYGMACFLGEKRLSK